MNEIIDGKLRLVKGQVELIASTPPSECWICDYIFSNIYRDDEGYYIKVSWLKEQDDGIIEHLKQLIGDFDLG